MATATALGLRSTLLFQLNLNAASLEVEERGAVVARCYWPLLELVERRPWLRFAIEVSGHTLERLARTDPAWITRLRALLESERIELVGSGDTLLIGPLVPAAVNRWNQALGRETYLRLLDRAPRVALVNEMAWSQGLIDAYLDAGYEALIMEWNDPRRFHPEWQEGWRQRTAWSQSPSGRRIRILWTDAPASPSFLRAVSGATLQERYLESVLEDGEGSRYAFLYAGAAEALAGASGAADGDWRRLGELCEALRAHGVPFTTPSHVLDDGRFAPAATLELSTPANPIPLRREPRRDVTRWALAGWENVGVNARCFARAKELLRLGGSARDWQLLCRAWGADLRAHLTEKRWRRFERSLPAAPAERSWPTAFPDAPLRSRRVERAGKRLAIGTDGVRAVLNLQRGLALETLVLRQAGPEPLLGTPPRTGPAADPWTDELASGHTVLEIPGEQRVTDLSAVEPEIEERTHFLCVRARVPTALGALPKEVRVHAQRLEIFYGFSAWGLRPRGRLRTAMLTLLDSAFGDELWVTCANGGPCERVRLVGECAPARGARDEFSSGAVFGATDGSIALDDGRIGFEVSWPQEESAALPFVAWQRLGTRRLVRLWFTLAEPDETIRPGAPLHDFRISIRPYRNRH